MICMTVMIKWPIPWDMRKAKEMLVNHLVENGYEVDAERLDWRVFKFRKKSKCWTQVYTGLTHRAKQERNGLKIVGIEASALPEYGFYYGGMFHGKCDK